MLRFNSSIKFALVIGLVLATDIAHSSPKQNSENGAERDVNGRRLLELFTPNQMEIVESCLTKVDSFQNKITIAELDHQNLITQVHSKPYVTTLTHWYDNQNLEPAKWAGPEANQELCLHHLEQLNVRVGQQYEEKSAGKDTNLIQLLDTYEWHTSGAFLGGNEWPGNYHECLRLKINSTGGLLATRYCSGAFKRNKWPKEGKLNQLLALRAGVCLPVSCDSTRYKNKYELVEKLVKYNARKVDESDIHLDYLYCLPDKRSTMRLWYYSLKTVAFVGAVAIWLSMLLFATFKYKSSAGNSSFGSNKSLYKSLSIVENASCLFSTTPTKIEERKVVDFGVVDGIKVIATCYVITSHALMGFSLVMDNGREMSVIDLSNLSFLLFLMIPSLAVNVFFSITGILTAYLLFKATKPIKFITSPCQWIVLVALRYIRIMPLYVLVVAYEKYLAKYAGSGPFWDYGTSSLSFRRDCEKEPWLWAFSFAANFKGPLEHCVPSAWYLANDFQFFMITPIFLMLLERWPRSGRLVMIGLVLTGYLLALAKIVTSDFDLKPMARFMPHGFSTYVFHLGDTYTRPQYRIPAYLCGLLIGHTLYRREHQKTMGTTEANQMMIDWPEWMKRYAVKISFLIIVSSFGLPFLGEYLQCNHQIYCRILIGILLPTYNLLFGLAAGLYIQLAATGHGNPSIRNFLASPRWKPLSRLNLCVVLVNIEVINYFAQTSSHLLYFDLKIIAGLYIFSIIMSYSVATVICVVFESPLRNLINNYLVVSLTKGMKKA